MKLYNNELVIINIIFCITINIVNYKYSYYRQLLGDLILPDFQNQVGHSDWACYLS